MIDVGPPNVEAIGLGEARGTALGRAQHVSARHPSLHHFVAQAEGSEHALLRRVREWVQPRMGLEDGGFWIIDDTGFPKKGRHSVGVARQYCGVLDRWIAFSPIGVVTESR